MQSEYFGFSSLKGLQAARSARMGSDLSYSLIPLEDSNSSSWCGAGPGCILSENLAQWSILENRVLGQKFWLQQTHKLHSDSDCDSSMGNR